MSKSKVRESKKLHYGKYLYKLKIYTQLSSIFRTELQRDGMFGYAKSKIKEMSLPSSSFTIKKRFKYEKSVSNDELKEAIEIIKILEVENENYLLRCEFNNLIIYTSNEGLLEKFDKSSIFVNEFYKPAPECVDFLTQNQNVIIINQPTDYPYKITFGRKKASIELGTWIEKNLDKVKAGTLLLHNLKNGSRWIQGQYIYVKNEKIVLLVKMMAGDNISRIDKMVYKSDIDK